MNEAPWQRITPLLPGKVENAGSSEADNRLFVNGCRWILHSGAHWKDLRDADGRSGQPVPDVRFNDRPRPSAGCERKRGVGIRRWGGAFRTGLQPPRSASLKPHLPVEPGQHDA
ncbi:transposase [Komagataeibacter europaeus]|uniref:transposase n=1 Tax=Komagataeibacter europaeus TaxID=33995 RepID=UPI0009DA5E94